MTDYLQIIPDDIVNYIVLFLDDESLLNLIEVYSGIPSVNNINRLKDNEILFENLTKRNFTGFYDDIKNIKNKNKKWYSVYQELISAIPEGKLDVYTEKSIPKDSYHRWDLSSDHVLRTEGIINFPPIIYEALFNRKFGGEYLELKGLANVPWKELYFIFESEHNETAQDISIESDMFDALIEELAKSDDIIEIWGIIAKNVNIWNYIDPDDLIGEFISNNINKMKLFKYLFEESRAFGVLDDSTIIYYLKMSMEVDNSELFEWILRKYLKINEDKSFLRNLLLKEVNMPAFVPKDKYRAIIGEYLSI